MKTQLRLLNRPIYLYGSIPLVRANAEETTGFANTTHTGMPEAEAGAE